jgi:hypothetical protein
LSNRAGRDGASCAAAQRQCVHDLIVTDVTPFRCKSSIPLCLGREINERNRKNAAKKILLRKNETIERNVSS